MAISMDPQLEELVRRNVASGRYGDANDVLREALDLLDKRDRLEALRVALASGDAQYARGEFTEWTPDFMEQMKREAEEAERLGLPIPDHVKPHSTRGAENER